MFDLTNKTAIITGGAGILGKGFSRELAKNGAKVAVTDVCYEKAEQVCLSILNEFPDARVMPLRCDVTDKANIAHMVETVKAQFSSIDILLNNAASKTNDLYQFFAPFEEYSIETWRKVMEVNLDGMFLVAQAVSREMISQNTGGSIIQTSSIYGVVAPDQGIYKGSEYMGVEINTPAVYSVSKGAVLSLTKYLATYLAKYNIRVNTLTPGGIESGQNDVFIKNYSSKVPLGRMGKFNELLGALVFLASDASSYVTGQNIIVDGGFTCW
ncbi:TPA: SDR family oxidoreductase [Legionella pneumophila]|uniref:Acetyoacetyl CoA reductase n=1 Tax=Legionella pneumophila TaxID=446 RepID=E5BD88_LEGPN|nr:SDR family oxidoreductase [Legionella pneumophila]MCK1862690.1 SDR family oxidoreductase [Legionella pneumophila]MCZ4699472.1 SDR family oxidoreductase [Legionella pneumophila]MCZ4730771.1 SDR family oxidoreductase [Legionella pneumophila]MCZ4753443.1 SDR family oxidoreductase [Legionella pneumophila]MDR9845071.1 SDR family oxidoreductase [Legionella pneumophila]